MARFVTSLSQEQLYRLLMSLNGTILPDGSRLNVKIYNWKTEITLAKKGAEGKETFSEWKGRILSRKDGSAVMRGYFGLSLFQCLLFAIPLSLIFFLLLLLLTGSSRSGLRHLSLFEVFFLSLYGDFWGIVIPLLGCYFVSFLILLSSNVNVEEQANRKILRDYLTQTFCQHTTIPR
ncbi:hypothetical protein [Flavonifractor sp. An91]|uniref:hypothetical protein n=1 Tax=Flavonifractor sp. An91 TaxID=1965665 RepID=UPI000B380C92|nr:hypothetical protein [Flavonifractor sp. An91]OUN14515.1 hypothetical protein B5G42_00135 [Flavonifractor sp. An91]